MKLNKWLEKNAKNRYFTEGILYREDGTEYGILPNDYSNLEIIKIKATGETATYNRKGDINA